MLSMSGEGYRKGGLSLVAGRVREGLRFLRLWGGVYPGVGADIGADDDFGRALVGLAGCGDFCNYVEIGTAHGLGSTKRIADVLLARPDFCRLWSVEVLRFVHAVAVRNWRGVDLRGGGRKAV